MNKHSAPHFCSIVADYRLYLKWGGVQEGGRVDGPGGPKVLRVLKFDSGFAAEGCGIALRAMSFICRLTAAGKPYNRASPAGNAPLSPPAAVLPPEGEVFSPLSF